jgi:hypothetical protein
MGNMTPKQQESIVKMLVSQQLQKEREAMERRAVTAIMMATVTALHDNFNWKADEYNKLIQHTISTFEAINEKYITLDDLLGLAEELGVVGL